MLWITTLALAGCDKDTDCKGTRVCEAGVCTTPATTAPLTPLVSPADRQELKLVRDGRNHYRYRGERIDWSIAEGIMRTYSRSDETLRKGRALRHWALGTGIAFGAIGAASVAMLPYVSHEPCNEYGCSGNVRSKAGVVASLNGMLWSSVVLLSVTLPLGLVSKGARNRSVERFNRAVERGEIAP